MASKKIPKGGQSLSLFSDAGTPNRNIQTTQRDSRLPKGLSPTEYEIDESDGLPREIVGPWIRDKHTRLQRYVNISGVGVRRKWLSHPKSAGATYIELLSGPGRVRIESESKAIDGSPVVAWRESVAVKAPFTQVWIADRDSNLKAAAETRLLGLGAPVQARVGAAADTVDEIVINLNPHALHFAFLDPYDLAALPFDVIKKLARLERMDILIHFSTLDLNRNLLEYIKRQSSPLDTFAPGWRDKIDDFGRPQEYIRGRIFQHWRGLLKGVGMDTAEAAELVTGSTNQPLYWLAFAARHPRALDFWEKIRRIDPDTASLLTLRE